ncbi:MAG TPA: 50S ribosomal protein L11 methyltransferase [Sphingobacterium sp.]|nr:50S ribosomal protein L11 methyltransferase [Sphingobacterium sp.]
MKYSAVHFGVTGIQEWQKDLLIAELADIGFDTFEDTARGFDAYIPTSNVDLSALETVLLVHVDGYHLDYEVEDIEEQNWNALWESNFNPIVVDGKCYVRATFHEAQPQYSYEIVIDPKMSFGTGHHQTTSMMLSFILEGDFGEKTVLDMGCGTGILAILASLRGARSVLAVDYDPVCVASVAENKSLNHISNIQEQLGSREVIEGYSFDAILANINRNILLEQMDTYARCLLNSGDLYISGFYWEEDLDILKEKCEQANLSYVEHKVLDKWCAAKFKKR